MRPTFFGGDATDLGNVRRLPQTSFRDLVDQVLNLATTLNVTREQYMAMDKTQRQRAKRVPYVVPASFSASPSRRLLDLAGPACLLCLDIDDPRQAAPFISSPEVIAEQLMPFSFATHTTASSTPEAPRVRVIVEAAYVPAARYQEALDDLARRLGLPAVTRESMIIVQPMYLPTLFQHDEGHPLIWSECGGRPYAEGDILGAPETRPGGPSQADLDDQLDYLRNPVDELTLQDAAGALAALDPDCSYAEWLDIAAGLRHQFPDEPLASQAYDLFDEWSGRGTKYVGAEDTMSKWSSLRQHPKGRAPVTMRTILKRAKEAGWSSAAVQERLFTAVRIRIRSYPDKDVERLLHEGLDWIASTPLLTRSEEEVLLQEVVRRLAAAKMKASLASLRRDLRARRAAAEREREVKQKVPTWARGLCYVSHVDHFFRPATGEQLSPVALDRAYGSQLLPSEEQLKEAGDVTVGSRAQPLLPPQDFLLNIVQVPKVYDYLYEPAQPNDVYLHVDGRAYVNTYVRNHPEPAPEDAAECGALFMGHLDRLIREDDYRDVLLYFIAHMVQRPGVKIRWAVLLQGAEGSGKTFLSDAVNAVLGCGHVSAIDGPALSGAWNEWAYGVQLVALEEVRVAGQSRHEVMNKLKPLITNERININQRFRDSRTVPNRANYLLFTNHHDALAVGGNDRRYYVLKSGLQTKAQVKALGGQRYFDPLYRMLKEKAAGLRAWLEQVAIPEDFPTNGPAPVTHYMAELVAAAASEPMTMLREAIDDAGNPLVRPDLLSSTTLRQILNNSGGEGKGVTSQYVAAMLRDEGWVSIGRYTVGHGKHTVWARADNTTPPHELMATFRDRAAEQPEAGTPEL